MGWPAPITPEGVALWTSCTIGDLKLPPDPKLGAVVVNCESSQKLDQATASGKDKAKTTQKGRAPCPVSIELRFHARSWAKVENALEIIDPNGIARGGPFKFSHPDAARRGVKWIMVEKVGKVEWKGHYGNVSIEATEWEEPKKVLSGGGPGAGAQKFNTTIGVLEGQIDSITSEIDEIDNKLGFIQRQFLTDAQQQALLRQREDLAAKLSQARSGLAQAVAQDRGASDTPDRAKDNASQNTAGAQKPTKAPKPDPYATTSAGAPDAEP